MTDSGNMILDCRFGPIAYVRGLAAALGAAGGHRRARLVHRADDRPDRGRCGRHSSDGAGRFRHGGTGHTVAHMESEMSNPHNYPPAFHLLAKPTGATCNLDCSYCFFLSKEMLYPGSRFRMADELLETYIRQLIEAHQTPEVPSPGRAANPR